VLTVKMPLQPRGYKTITETDRLKGIKMFEKDGGIK